MTCYTTNSFEGKIIKLKLKLKWGTCCLAFLIYSSIGGGNESKYYNIYIYNDTGKKFLCSLLKSMAIINNCFPFIYIIVNIMKTNKNEELGKDQCKKNL